MKWLLIIGSMVAVIGIGLKMAVQTGEKSPKFVEGTIELPPKYEAKATGISTLFVIIYDLDSKRPMPYGAVKFKLDENPKAGKFFPFLITREKLQIMAGQMAPAPQRMRLKARLDKDGLGGMDQPGDLTGGVSEVAFGSSDITISLNNLVGS